MSAYDRLTALDASFLHLESPETPMHVGALGIFEGAPFFDATGRFQLAKVRQLVASRLGLIPRFRKRLMTVPLDQGRPIWIDDHHFDISYHVRLTALPAPGDMEQLLTLTARIEAQVLDRARPLWELWFVEGLADDRVALVQKTHHAMVDGVSGVDVATILLDFTPEPTILPPAGWIPESAPSAAKLLADTLLERSTEPTEMVRSVRGAARTPQRLVERGAQLGRAVTSLVGSSPIAPRTSLNAPVGRRKRFAGVRIDLDDVRAVRAAFGGTINDVVLTGVGGALARRLTARGEVPPEHLRVLCPVSVRTAHEHGALGNKISAMFVDLSTDADPVVRLATVAVNTATLKEQEQPVAASTLLELSEFAAPTILGLAARLVQRQPFVNLVVTNVPGPQQPLYCMGARMLEAYPIVPLSKNLSIGIAILSYCGALHLGLYADGDAWPDLDGFVADVEASFAELRAAAEDRVHEGAVG